MTLSKETIGNVIEKLEHFAQNLKWTDVRGAQDLLAAANGLRELLERRERDKQKPLLILRPFGGLDQHAYVECPASHPFAMAVYAAPTAPVVPDNIRNRLKAEGVAQVLADANEYAPLTAGQWETLTNNWYQTFVGLSGDESTCRAAMLTETISNSSDIAIDEASQSFGNSEQLNSPVTPDGWAVVPIEPTDEMLHALYHLGPRLVKPCETELYRAMLAAAPKQESE